MPTVDPASSEQSALERAVKCPAPGDRVHMLGIGGVGMAGLALLLQSRGWDVTGCDAHPGPLMAWLNRQGIPASVGHDPAHLTTRPSFVVRSPAVWRSEPELMAAARAGVPIIDRGRLLPELLKDRKTIAVAGTHGKTTTSSMVAWFLAAAGKPHSYCIGGVCPGLGAVARVDAEGWMVVEADESDGTLKHYVPEVAIITSMDLDHVDYYHDRARQRDVFGTFAGHAGHLIVPEDEAAFFSSRPGGTVSFGCSPHAAWRASRISLMADGSHFDLTVDDTFRGTVHMSVPGRHNVMNALAAMAAGRRAGLAIEEMIMAMPAFQLPKRRYELVAEGSGIRVISDYAHHPVEIAALLEQARLSCPKRIVAVFQPHRYSRTKAFREQFVDVLSAVDALILLPVYAASEAFMEDGTSDALWAACRQRQLTGVYLADSLMDAWKRLQQIWRSGDLVLIIGAGDVDKIGAQVAEHLAGPKVERNTDKSS